MTRLDATALAVLMSLAGEGRGDDLRRGMSDPESAALAGNLIGKAAGLAAPARAEFLFGLAGDILREEIRWVDR